jgi:type II restriction enzyme
MKFIDAYKRIGLQNEEEVFNYFINTLKPSIATYDYFVAWDKIEHNLSSINVSLHILNSIIGKPNISKEFKNILVQYPQVITTFPLLIACRRSSIFVSDVGKEKVFLFSKSKKYTEREINDIVIFAEKCGLLNIFEDRKITNLLDYVFGVEVGLDTNARKNRTGTSMENLVKKYVCDICNKFGYSFLSQAKAVKIMQEYGIKIPHDKTDRHFDFLINGKNHSFIIETNFYSGGGSKLKSVAGEFITLSRLVKLNPALSFIWVTDGIGWKTTKNSLRETFDAIDYIFNIKMLEEKLLEILLQGHAKE